MNRAENTIVGTLDRRREREGAKEARTARRAHLQARAVSVIACELGEVPDHERSDHAEHLAGAVRQHLVRLHGEATAASILSQQAAIAGANLLPKGAARHAAERLFTPANDRDGEEA